MFSAFSAASAGLALTLASVALTVRFLRRGSPTALALASACAGLTLGVSAFGFVAAAVSLAVLKVAAVGKARRASDKFERLGLCLTVLYLAIAAVSSVMLLNPALVVIVSGATLRVETGMIVLSCVLYAYNVLLSTTCLLVDVRCGRSPDDDGERALSLRGAVRALYAIACLVPLALLTLVSASLVAHLLLS